jgi:hypothetical protein
MRLRSVKLPDDMSEELAEIVGIHFGDGYMKIRPRRTYILTYALNSDDTDYIHHVSGLFHDVFGITLTRRQIQGKRCVEIYCCSRMLCEYFHHVLEVPYSPKNNLTIPSFIRNDPRWQSAFLRGLFDTDGCYTVSVTGPYRYELTKITMKSESFAIEVCNLLSSMGIKSYICNKGSFDVVIRRRESSQRFQDLIRPNKTRQITSR